MADQKSPAGRSRRRNRKARYHDLQVKVEESFSLHEPREVSSQDRPAVGDGCYVSATVNNNRRFYGVLVDQEALKAASLLYFQDEAGGLELNRKMHTLLQQQNDETLPVEQIVADQKRPAANHLSKTSHKRVKPDNAFITSVLGETRAARHVQKFRYVQPEGNGSSQGYRLLLATYADVSAAAEDDADRARRIQVACESGGNFVGEYFYQYEVKCLALEAGNHIRDPDPNEMRMSMGFQSFLQTTSLPPWFPLSNLQVDQQKVLGILSMKRDSNGNAVWNNTSDISKAAATRSNLAPMTTRSRFRVAVLGGGISGLSCCREIFRECERQQIPVEVVLLEGRNRFGGRLWTDRETFKHNDGVTSFPVDLGASWIHGIELNPLAAIAREAGVDFVTSSEDVKMFEAGMKEVDHGKDERAGEVFDKLLDLAAEDCWKSNPVANGLEAKQVAVRWYAGILDEMSSDLSDCRPVATVTPPHRQSGDISVDRAVGRAIAEKRTSEFTRLSNEERRMLLWNLKNVEYALGANIRESGILPKDYILRAPPGNRHVIELSDTCRITSEDSSQTVDSDFVVSCIPLGVLKEAIRDDPDAKRIRFDPPLPFSKRDAIESVGFGLLDKVYLQFPFPFWRVEGIIEDDQTLFGNASGINPHHYMFFDIGKSLGSSLESPAVLMSLVSGREAVKCECMTEKELVNEAVDTLRTLFFGLSVPDPVAFKVTRWGKDRFSRGSYTFLPPGTTDQDFELLRSPINGNGDSILLEGSETMRLFFAGEHTTALHPSMAHGALLSGVRAAKEVVSAMTLSFDSDESIDKLIPMPLFRSMNPKTPLYCSLCHRVGTTIREGSLLAFKRGARQVLVHNNCAENSPEVEVFEGNWKNVFRAINRSRSIECLLCGRDGASIGCSDAHCFRCYHFSCAEDTGWRFDRDGKEYFCDLHRTVDGTQTVRVSLDFYKSVQGRHEALLCGLCGGFGQDRKCGSLLAFRKGNKLTVVHENCARYSTICDIGEDSSSRMEQEYRNIFDVISLAKKCEGCSKPGATVKCSEPSCSHCFHFSCAKDTTWDFFKRPRFRCPIHRKQDFSGIPKKDNFVASRPGRTGAIFQHTLFSAGALGPTNKDVPGNLDIDRADLLPKKSDEIVLDSSSDDDYSSEEEQEINRAMSLEEQNRADTPTVSKPDELLERKVKVDYILTSEYVTNQRVETRLARLFRSTVSDPWNVEFYITRLPGGHTKKAVLSVAMARPDPYDELRDGDVVTAINGFPVGSPEMDTLEKVLSRLSQEVDAMIEVVRVLY